MGGCVSPTRSKNSGEEYKGKPNNKVPNSKLKPAYEKLLKLLFNDLTDRVGSDYVAPETFEVFFHLSGLWGSEIFRRFDTKNLGRLDFEDFRNGIETLVKGSFQQRVHALFKFYDIYESNGISYDELLMMLYSYPKEYLKKMLDDEKFIESMSPEERIYHFGKGGKAQRLDDAKEVVEEVEEESSTENDIRRKDREVAAQPLTIFEPEMKRNTSKQSNKSSLKTCTSSMLIDPLRPYGTRAKRSSSISYSNIGKKNLKVVSNISLLVKKYASFLFNYFNIDKDEAELNEKQFQSLIEKHSKIFTSYFDVFHNYAWYVDHQDIPLSRFYECWISSQSLYVDLREGKQSMCYVKFIRTTLFIYERQSDWAPIAIKNLEGLLVEYFNKEESNLPSKGFLVKHRDGLYPEKAYLFESKYEQYEWLKHLKDFRNNSVYDLYQLQENIGTGNFSTVFRGKEKQGEKKEVAIKVIEKHKLNEQEYNVIKHECKILELCHHPQIIKYFNRIESKTHIFIITYLMTEGVLYEYVKKKGFLEEFEASRVLKQLIDAVLNLNKMGLIHRDLKAYNIMVSQYVMQIKMDKERGVIKKVKIIDFGFAVYQDQLKEMNDDKKFAGTPGYVPPEVLEGKDYDETVDNFSLGVLLYFMLSGMLPFHSRVPGYTISLTLRCSVSLKNYHWNNITNGVNILVDFYAKYLVYGLMAPKGQRMSLEDASKSPWITEGEELASIAGRNPRSPTSKKSL